MKEAGEFLKDKVEIKYVSDLLRKVADSKSEEETARYLAESRILDSFKVELNKNPLPPEIDYEKKNIKNSPRKKGIIYSGLRFLDLLKENLPYRNYSKDFLIYLSDQFLATYEDRWHLRVVILSVPSIISVPGIIYAPARDRKYYITREIAPSVAEKTFKGEFLCEDDKRLTDCLKGYLLQALYYWRTLRKGENFSFCEDKNCSLYNSHYQKEVLQAQYHHRLCERHRKELETSG